PIDQLKEVRRGPHVGHPEGQRSCRRYPADCAFTVIYGEDFLSMDLVAVSLDDANVWVTGLTCLINGRPGQLCAWLEEVFSAASLDEDGFLDEQDVIQLMKKLNSGVNTSRIKKKLKEVDIANAISSRGRLSSSEFVNLFKEISTRPEVYFLLVREVQRVEGYEKALKSQVRCIELEVWKRAPMMSRSYTTAPHPHSKIGLRDVLDTHAANPEHREPLQPGPAVPHGGSSFVPPLATGCWTPALPASRTFNTAVGSSLLTPSRLRRRILVKCKKLPPRQKVALSAGCERQVATVQQSAVAFGYVSEEDDNVDIQRDRSPKAFKKAGNQSTATAAAAAAAAAPPQQQQQQCGRRIKLSQELSDLAALGSERFADLDDCCFHFYKSDSAQAASRRQPDHQQQHQLLHQQVWSISESAAFRLAQSDMDGLVEYSRRCLVQVQPNAIRVDSSNYNPQDMWRLRLSAARRRRLGLGAAQPPYSRHQRLAAAEATRAPLLRATSPTPCVVVEVFGLPADCSEERTKTVHGNGYNPVFDECFEFRVSLPELALLRLVVLDDDAIGDDFIGQFTIPFDCIQT
uniref:Phosphoinositide phospholipase C n=1 Tax=Macrostomum lignano TaxID=282301 RepID=A0A1I8F7Y7_9PLAT